VLKTNKCCFLYGEKKYFSKSAKKGDKSSSNIATLCPITAFSTDTVKAYIKAYKKGKRIKYVTQSKRNKRITGF
jgi:hypothetical protein